MNAIKKILHNLINHSFLICYFIVLLIVIFFTPDVMRSMPFAKNNLLLIIIGILFISIFTYYFKRKKPNYSTKKVLLIFSISLFIFHLILIFNILFKTGWDAGTVMDAAYNNIYNKTPNMEYFNKDYFSIYPNNILLLFLEMLICFTIKILSGNYFIYNLALVFINSIIFITTGILLYLILNKTLKNKTLSILGLSIYTILIGTSPWVLIPYSDCLGLIFVISIIYIYIFLNQNNLIKYFIISLLSFIGLQLKPQIFILFIAITIIELIKLISTKKIKTTIKYLGIILVSSLIVTLPVSILKDSLNLDKEKQFGITHFLMMGLNYETSGIYSQDDVNFSYSLPTKAIRTKKNIEVFKTRLSNYGSHKLLKHLKNKVLINYNDGTFAFGEEGTFYNYIYKNKIKSAKFFKQLFYTTGDYYNIISTIRQLVWLLVLLLLIPKINHKDEEYNLILKLALLGLLFYLLLFEARSRYLFIYIPAFIIIATKNLDNIFDQLKKKGH